MGLADKILESMNEALTKSKWAELLKALESGVMYYGSGFNQDPEKVAKKIDSMKMEKFSPDRKLVSGKNSLKLEKPDGSTSSLLKKGVVYKYKNFYLVYDKSDGSNLIVYRAK